MGCFRPKRSKTTTNNNSSSNEAIPTIPPYVMDNPEPKNLKQELLLHIPACTVFLMEGGEAIELAKGEFTLVRILDNGVSLATIVRIGDLQWPLTKDEPVVKLDVLHYLFSLPMKDGDPLSYGVTFFPQYGSSLGVLDSFLCEHSCFSSQASGSTNGTRNGLDWQEFAPSVEAYNNFLAKAIAGGTGQIVRGIFQCSNVYTNQVYKGGEMIITSAAEAKHGPTTAEIAMNSNRAAGAPKKSKVNKSLKRVRKLSKMTDKLSKAMLDGLGVVTGSVMAPVVKSQAGKAFLSMVPGEVLLASLDAVNKVLDAAEAAEKQALSATSKATRRMVTNKFGENAGEAAEDVFATVGHCASIGWNIFKIRKVINPASAVSTGVLKNAATNRNRRS